MVMKFTNNATSTLASGITNVATSLTVASSQGALFPTLSGDYFYCTLANIAGAIEIVKVTARTSDTFTITRGQDGTTGLAWNTGDKVELRLVAASLNDLPKLDESNTFVAKQIFSGSTSLIAMKTSNIAEVNTVSATAATGTINFDLTTQSVLYYTSNSSGNFTINFRASSGTSLNTMMATGECISATFLCTNNATAYYNSAVTIDGTSVTPKWQNGTAPTSGNASAVDCYSYVIQKTGSATYVVLASLTKFA